MTERDSSALILGDQLNFNTSSLNHGAKNVLMVESADRCGSGKWHKRRVVFVISAMRHFGDELRKKGYEVESKTFLNNMEKPKKVG